MHYITHRNTSSINIHLYYPTLCICMVLHALQLKTDCIYRPAYVEAENSRQLFSHAYFAQRLISSSGSITFFFHEHLNRVPILSRGSLLWASSGIQINICKRTHRHGGAVASRSPSCWQGHQKFLENLFFFYYYFKKSCGDCAEEKNKPEEDQAQGGTSPVMSKVLPWRICGIYPAFVCLLRMC